MRLACGILGSGLMWKGCFDVLRKGAAKEACDVAIEGGKATFYKGAVAKAIVAAVQAEGGAAPRYQGQAVPWAAAACAEASPPPTMSRPLPPHAQ